MAIRERAIRITGTWELSDEEVLERMDAALHNAGLCGCADAGHFFVMSITPIPSWEGVEEMPDEDL